MKVFNKIIAVVIIMTLSFSQSLSERPLNNTVITGEKYVSGQDGIARIYINVWGHVKFPGTYDL